MGTSAQGRGQTVAAQTVIVSEGRTPGLMDHLGKARGPRHSGPSIVSANVDLRVLTGWQAPASSGFHLSVNVAQVTTGSAKLEELLNNLTALPVPTNVEVGNDVGKELDIDSPPTVQSPAATDRDARHTQFFAR